MNKAFFRILSLLLTASAAHADTPLTIDSSSPYGCLQNAYLYPTPQQVSSTFTLPGIPGNCSLTSTVPASAPTFGFPPTAYFYNYSIDLSQLPAATSHCVKLLVHFGTPNGCGYETVYGSPAVIQSATLQAFGDITFVFNSGCLNPGQPAVGFLMFSEAIPKTNVVTVIDDYVDPASGVTNHARINVPAIVPDIPPNPPWWAFYRPINIPNPFFQGFINNCNSIPIYTNISGAYDFRLQLLNDTNLTLAGSQVATQKVQVVNGLFNVPLPFDPINMGDGSSKWLSLSVRPSGSQNGFTAVNPPMPLTPTPQAFYAYSAGVVADLTPGQAVTSLNGLTDAVTLQPGQGIIFGTNGNNLIISAQAGVGSDRNIKTDFGAIRPEEILMQLAQLPISSWRYTNETAAVRHVGPMAQDFKAAFGLGDSDKLIGFVDEQGVALAAIQALYRQVQEQAGKLKEKEGQIDNLQRRNEALEQRLDRLERRAN